MTPSAANGGRSSRTAWIPPHALARTRHEQAIIDACERIERARQEMQDAARELAQLTAAKANGWDPGLFGEAEWPERWQQFLAAGGVTADVLRRWLIRSRRDPAETIRPVQRRHHLRLIGASNPAYDGRENRRLGT